MPGGHRGGARRGEHHAGDLPEGTKFAFETQPSTDKPGTYTTNVIVTYPDGSVDTVPVKVTVRPLSDTTDPKGADITFVRGPILEFVDDLKDAAGGRNVWVVGGGVLAAQFADAGLLDELIVSVIPVVLGGGKPLLPMSGPTPPLELVSSRTMGRGIVELRYRFPGRT